MDRDYLVLCGFLVNNWIYGDGMIDWSKAPEGAQFFSCGNFRKHEGESEYYYRNIKWVKTRFDQLDWHGKNYHDFEVRPIQIGDVYEIISYYGAMLEDDVFPNDLFSVEMFSGGFAKCCGWSIKEKDILNGYIRLVSTANTKQEETYMYGDMADISDDSPIGNILKNGQKYKATEKYRQKLTIAAVHGLSSNPAYIQSLLEQGLSCTSDIAYHASLIADNVIDKEWLSDDENE